MHACCYRAFSMARGLDKGCSVRMTDCLWAKEGVGKWRKNHTDCYREGQVLSAAIATKTVWENNCQTVREGTGNNVEQWQLLNCTARTRFTKCVVSICTWTVHCCWGKKNTKRGVCATWSLKTKKMIIKTALFTDSVLKVSFPGQAVYNTLDTSRWYAEAHVSDWSLRHNTSDHVIWLW